MYFVKCISMRRGGSARTDVLRLYGISLVLDHPAGDKNKKAVTKKQGRKKVSREKRDSWSRETCIRAKPNVVLKLL